jgi:hypothetical protein
VQPVSEEEQRVHTAMQDPEAAAYCEIQRPAEGLGHCRVAPSKAASRAPWDARGSTLVLC